MESHKKPKEPILEPKAAFHFNFILDRVNVDWQSINAVDIDLLMRQVDIRALQEHIRDVTFCCLDGVQCQQCLTPVDPTFVKLFRLAQLSLQWLDYCQKTIVFNMNTIEKKLKKSDTKCKKLQDKNKEQEQKMKQMVSELKARRNIIQKQQSLFATDMSSSIQCQHCDKKYMNAFFLQEHMLRRHPNQCQNLTDQIGQKDSEIESLKLEISSLRTQMAQTAEEQNQRLQQEVWKVQQGKTELHTEKEKLQLEKSKMQMEVQNLQQENLRLKTENLHLQHETLDMQTKNVRLQQEKVELQKAKEELQQETMMSQAENLKLQQEKLQLVMEKGKLQQGILEVREEAVKLQQENLTLESENRKLKTKRKEQRLQQRNGRKQTKKNLKQTVKILSEPVSPKKTSTASPAKVSRMYPSSSFSSSSCSSSFSSEESEAEGDDSEQEKTKVKNQPVNQKCDLSQELSEERQMFPSCPQLTGVSERGQLQTNNKLTGNKEGEPDTDQSLSWSWWEAAQFSLPSKVIQVKPAATVSKPNSQPVEPHKTSTTPPKKASAICPSYFSSCSSEESEAEGDDSEQTKTKVRNQPVNQKCDLSQELSENNQTFPFHPQLTGVSETSQLQTNKLTGNKEGEPDNELQDFRLLSKVPVEPSLTGREPKTQPGATKKTSRAPPKKVSFLQEKNLPSNLNKKKREKEPQKVVKSQTLCQDGQMLPSRPQLTTVSDGTQLQTYKLSLNKKNNLKGLFKKVLGKKSVPKGGENNSAERIVEVQKAKCQQKQLKGFQNITPRIKRSTANGQVSQLEQKTVEKYPWFHKNN